MDNTRESRTAKTRIFLDILNIFNHIRIKGIRLFHEKKVYTGGGFGQICSIPEPKRHPKNILFGVQNSKLLNFHFLNFISRIQIC